MDIVNSTTIYTGHEADVEAISALDDVPDQAAPEHGPSFDAFWERCRIDVSNW